MGVKALSVVDNPEHPGAQRLARSAKFWGWDHTFVVKADQADLTPPYQVWYPSYRAEQLGQLDFIRTKQPDYTLYLDGYDTVFTGPPEELVLEPWQLTFSGDTVLYPEDTLMENYFLKEVGWEGFPFVNCGVMWGDSRVMSELAADYLQHSPEKMCNQKYFNARYIFERMVERDRLRIDTHAKVALNIMLLQQRFFEMDGVRPRHKIFGTRPLVVHAPGRGSLHKSGMVPLPKELEELYA